MEIIGWIGTTLVIVAYYPQIRHLRREKCAWGLSLTTWLIWLVSSLFLLAYSILEHDMLFTAVQIINIAAIVITIILVRRSDRVCPFHAGSATPIRSSLGSVESTKSKKERGMGERRGTVAVAVIKQ